MFIQQLAAPIGTHAYAGEMAWREDQRRVANGSQYLNAAGAALGHPKSERWCGYWNRNGKGAALWPSRM